MESSGIMDQLVSLDDAAPNYMKTTGNMLQHEKANHSRYAVTLKERDEQTQRRRYEETINPKKRIPRKKEILSIPEILQNEAVVESMTRKLDYLRNPRNNKEAVSRTIVHTNNHARTEDIDFDSSDDELDIPQVSVSKRTTASKSTITATAKSKSTSFSADLPKIPLFEAEPSVMIFSGYTPGQRLKQEVSFRNVSTIARTMRLIPSSTQYFSVSPLRYPKTHRDGELAPGMSATATVTFAPDSAGNFYDKLRVETENGGFDVPIVAELESPQLDLPLDLDIGTCLIGDASSVVVTCTNAGGAGRFRLLHPDFFPSVPVDLDWVNMGCIRIAPFTVYPVEFALKHGESIDLTVEYLPKVLGVSGATFYILTDSGKVWEHNLIGHTRTIDLSVVAVNDVNITKLLPTGENENSEAADALDETVVQTVSNEGPVTIMRDVVFQNVYVGTDEQQSIQVQNNTFMPLEYQWVWVDPDPDQDTFLTTSLHKLHALPAPVHSVDGSFGMDGCLGTLENPTFKSSQEGVYPATLRVCAGGMQEEVGDRFSADDKNQSFPDMTQGTFDSLKAIEVGSQSAMSAGQAGVNAAVEDGFSISPGNGFFNGSQDPVSFKITYTPTGVERREKVAVLMLRNVPQVSIWGPKQGMLMDKLAQDGHGELHRLKSWMALIGTHLPLPRKTNTPLKGIDKFLSVQLLADMTRAHAMEEAPTDVYIQFEEWVKAVLLHAYACRNRLLDVNDSDDERDILATESSSAGLHGDDLKVFNINTYDWRPTKGTGADDAEADPPRLLYPLKLSTSPMQFDKLKTFAGSMGIDDEMVVVNTHRAILEDIWVDIPTALNVLRPTLANILDKKVKHEAITYIHDLSRDCVMSLTSKVIATGQVPKVTVSPPRLLSGGSLSVGKTWTGKVLLKNTSKSTVKLLLDTENFEVQTLAYDNWSLIQDVNTLDPVENVSKRYFDVATDLVRVTLPPDSEEFVTVSVKVQVPGKFEIIVPLKPSNPLYETESIVVGLDLTCPRVRFHQPEIDLGLIGVGLETEKVITFVNEGSIPVTYMLKGTLLNDAQKRDALQSGTASARLSGRKSARSARSSTKSEDFNMSVNGSFQIDDPNTRINLIPPAGSVQPNETVSITIQCKAGAKPERVRGILECFLFDSSGEVRLPCHSLSIRGEVQSPKTIMYPMHVDVGKVYIGVPVTFDMNIENLCNLPAKYKYERPGGDSYLYKLEYSEKKGTLEQKEKVTAKVTFTATNTGVIDDVQACKVFGVKYPLGYTVAGTAKDVLLEFVPMHEPTDLPPPNLAPKDAPRFPGGGDPPEPAPIQPLEFGRAVPLYERRYVRFAIRNFSAIPTPYTIRVKKYEVVEEKTPQYGSGVVASISSLLESAKSKTRKDLIIAPHEDGENKFSSEAGKKYIGLHIQKQEDLLFLKNGLGASYYIDPVEGVLEPWGVDVVTIRAFNNAPGEYNDDVVCSITDARGGTRDYTIPLKMTVTGCPLLVERDTVGMSIVRKGSEDILGKQILQMGYACCNCDPLVREFRVVNNGAKLAKVKWLIRKIPPKVNGPVNFKIRVDKKGKVKARVKLWDDVLKNTPYTIEPPKVLIGPYSRQLFKVTLSHTTDEGLEQAMLTGTIAFDDGSSKMTMSSTMLDSPPNELEVPSGEAGGGEEGAVEENTVASIRDDNYKLTVVLQGDLMLPALRIDQSTYTAKDDTFIIPKNDTLVFRTAAPVLYARGTKPSEVCWKEISVVNPTDATLTFSATVDGPFTIKQSGDSAGVPSTASSQMGRSSASPLVMTSMTSTFGKTYSLLPNGSASIRVAFTPKRDLRDTFMSSQSLDEISHRKTDQFGNLVFTFSTGQSMQLPLSTIISTPFISTSAPIVYFGTCHVKRFCASSILLSNSTEVSASWNVEHVPGKGHVVKQTSIDVRGYEDDAITEDDPTVFEITPTGGLLEGPTVSVAAATAAPPTDNVRMPEQDTVVSQHLVKTAWTSGTLNIRDSMQLKHDTQHATLAEPIYPLPIAIKFSPKKNVRYISRFRFTCEFGNAFDIVIQGSGTYEEHDHNPISSYPRQTMRHNIIPYIPDKK